ncbi:MAG: hypothetical protein N3H30_00975 [Candidatus Micrarchaeota archaeon]|nr:hypothetical protein [Candidatus Micrarchaeota archaeon]
MATIVLGAFSFTEFFVTFVPVAVLLAVIHILFVSLLYMVGKALQNDNIVGMARHEFMQAIYSAIIVGSILGSLIVLNSVFCSAIPSDYYNGSCDASQDLIMAAHIKVARAHLAESYNNIRVLAKGMLRAYDWAATAASLKKSGGLFSLSPLAFKEIDAFIFAESFSILSKVLIFVKAQELFLVINAVYFFPVFFNIGLALRVLPFTRKIGGLLMGITLGLFFALPYMYILSQSFIDLNGHFSTKFIIDSAPYAFTFFNMFHPLVESQQASIDDLIEEAIEKDIGNPLGYAAAKSLDGGVGYNIASLGEVPDPSGNRAFGTAADFDPQDPANKKYSILEIVARVIAAVTVSSIFSLVATIAAIRETSRLFGGDVEIAGLTRLI